MIKDLYVGIAETIFIQRGQSLKINKKTEEIYAVGVYNKGYLREDGTIINNVLKANFFDVLEAAELVRDNL